MKLNCILLGDCKVGKTHFLSHFRSINSSKYIPTIGIDYQKYKQLHIWDTSGAQRYISILRTFIKTSDICIICYNDAKSFESIDVYKNMILSYGKDTCEIIIVSFSKEIEIEVEGVIYSSVKKYPFVSCNVNNKEECRAILEKLIKENKPIFNKHKQDENVRQCWWNLW